MTPQTMHYEYYVITNSTYVEASLLNRLGEQGWELITHVYDNECQLSDRHVYAFKRLVSKTVE